MRYRQLGKTGLKLSEIGFGGSPLGNVFGDVEEDETLRAVHLALDRGVNLFDVAPYYGGTLAETRLGRALKGRRKEAVISTKCARFGLDDFDFSAQRAHTSINESLLRLQTDYVDILHVHDIEFGDKRQIIDETLPALTEIKKSGKARFIGITGLSLRMLREVATEFPVDCMLSYCRYDFLNQDLDTELAPFAELNGIGLINASPLHMGLLSELGAPEWHPAPQPVKAAAHAIIELCRIRNVDVSAVALQFACANPAVASTLAGMATQDHVVANVNAVGGEPNAELLAEIAALAKPVLHLMWISGKPENH